MAIRQLSVFVENKKGSLHEITDVLAKAGIDLRSMCIADTSDYGIVRMITDDTERAYNVLTEAGQTANVRTVTAFAVPDCPGGLAKVLALLDGEGVNMEYMYGLSIDGEQASVVMKAKELAAAEAAITAYGVATVSLEKLDAI